MAPKRQREAKTVISSRKRSKLGQAARKEDFLTPQEFAYSTDWSTSDTEDEHLTLRAVTGNKVDFRGQPTAQSVRRMPSRAIRHEDQAVGHTEFEAQPSVDLFGDPRLEEPFNCLSEAEDESASCLNLEIPRYMVRRDEIDIFDIESSPEPANNNRVPQYPFLQEADPETNDIGAYSRVQLTQQEFGLLEGRVFVAMLRNGQEIYINSDANRRPDESIRPDFRHCDDK